jgi:hypothetical protein
VIPDVPTRSQRRLLLDLTTSLDGFIADSHEGVDWIQAPPDDAPAEYPADYLELMNSVDALVMGRATDELSLRLPGGTEAFTGEGQPVAGTTIWSIGPAQGDHFAPSTAPFMSNYRVEDLYALVEVRLGHRPGRQQGRTVAAACRPVIGQSASAPTAHGPDVHLNGELP